MFFEVHIGTHEKWQMFCRHTKEFFLVFLFKFKSKYSACIVYLIILLSTTTKRLQLYFLRAYMKNEISIFSLFW